MALSVRFGPIVGLIFLVSAPLQAETFACAAGNVQCLIAAINEANTNGEKQNTIHLDQGVYTLRNIDNDNDIDGPNGLPSIKGTLTINVPGNKRATIERASDAPKFRLLHVGESGRLRLEGLTLSHGSGFFGGALSNHGVVTISNSNVVSNEASSGGALDNHGVVTISDCSFVSNHAQGTGGLRNRDGTVTIVDSTFDRNTGFGGAGALDNIGGELTIERTTFSNNTADIAGALIISSNAVVHIAQSRFTNNLSEGIGGNIGAIDAIGGVISISETTFDGNAGFGVSAIGVAGVDTKLAVTDSAFVGNHGDAAIGNIGATVQVTNVTFARNVFSPAGSEDGIVIRNLLGSLNLTNSTFAENTMQAPQSGRLFHVISSFSGARIILQNVILAHNTGEPFVQNCDIATSLGNNLIDDPSGCEIILQSSDLIGDPGLGNFTDNGTPGNGHFPLLPTSRAIDAANDTVCPKKDQIGRPRQAHCDIGAVEFSHKFK